MRLEVTTDGRFLTFILASLYEAGYGVQVFGGDWFFRELMLLRKSASIPFLYGGKEQDCGVAITDRPPTLDARRSTHIVLDYDYFSDKRTELKMPYFMIPKALHFGYHKKYQVHLRAPRRIRIGFHGNNDMDTYSRYFRFSILPRSAILERFFMKFAGNSKPVSPENVDHIYAKIGISFDVSNLKNIKRFFLQTPEYFRALEATDFMLSPPGWCMPQAHNIVESMSRGVIPILNYAHYMVPKLEHGVNCLAFSTLEEMEIQIRDALSMSQESILEMRENVSAYYEEFQMPGPWWRRILDGRDKTVLVNHEEYSVGLIDPDFLIAAAEYIGSPSSI